jgi:hypothetical protein
MPYYETLILADPRLGRGELHELLKRVVLRFLDSGGVVTRLRALPSAFSSATLDSAAARPLPQKLRGPTREHHRTAIFVECDAFLFPHTLPGLQRQLRLEEQILRILTVRRPAIEAVTSARATERGAVTEQQIKGARKSQRAPSAVVTATSPVSGLEMFVEEFEARHPSGMAVYDAYRQQENPFRGSPSTATPGEDSNQFP